MAMAAPHTRLFILGGKGISEEEFRETFGAYGTIKDVWIVKDKVTNESKGVVYITFDKASEAALALEEMNGRAVGSQTRPLKVLLANDRRDGSVREQKENEKLLRLFVKIPKSFEEKDVERVFSEYGEIDSIKIIRDRSSGESKGLSYVKYRRAYHAALALENCDPSYRAVFAQSKSSGEGRSHHDDRYNVEDLEIRPGQSRNYGGHYSGGAQGLSPQEMISRSVPYENTETRLEVMTSSAVSQEQLYKLLDLVPGMDYCDFDRHSCIAYVRYNSPQCAYYAREKLNGLEYPPGYRLSARFAGERFPQSNFSGDMMPMEQNAMAGVGDLNQQMSQLTDGPSGPESLQSLVGVVKKAMGMLEAAGFSVNDDNNFNASSMPGGKVQVTYCDNPLPEKKPLMPRNTPTGERLFIVSQPDSFPERVLQDCFCRFGSLIDAYFMPGRNFGYVKYGDKENARVAMEALHGEIICGSRLKVMLADPPKYEDHHDSTAKKQRT